MPTLAGPGIDPTLAGPVDVFVSGTDLDMPIPPAPETGPDWEAGSGLPLFQVVLGRAVKREVIGELTTADLDDWCDEVELLAGTAGTIAASSWDPLWEACAETVTMGADGEPKYTFDPGGFVVWVYEDSACVWTGRFAEPVSIGGGRVVLPAQGPPVQVLAQVPQAVWAEPSEPEAVWAELSEAVAPWVAACSAAVAPWVVAACSAVAVPSVTVRRIMARRASAVGLSTGVDGVLAVVS